MSNQIQLSVPQARVYSDPSRFRYLNAGRRFGKSFLLIVEIWRAATIARNQLVWYVAPSYGQARDIIWNALIQFIPRHLMKKAPNESRLEIQLVNGSIIVIKGAGNKDTLVGRGLDYLCVDEAPIIDEDVWQLLRPALSDKKGKALFVGTPRGYNWCYDIWEMGTPGFVPTDDMMKRKDYIDPRMMWSSHQYTTLQGGNVDRDEIIMAKQDMSEAMYAQEYLASFQSLSGLVYCNFDVTRHLDQSIQYNPDMPVLVGMDFNVNPMTCSLGQVNFVDRGKKKQRELHIFDEIFIEHSNTQQMAEEISNRFPGKNIIVYPDASGNSRKTSAETNKTDHTILKSYGFTVESPNANPYQVDRINEVNTLFKNKSGQERCFIHPKCRNLQKTLNGLTYKKGTSLPDKDGGLDHMGDGLGYLIHKTFPINAVGSTSVNMGLG